MNPTRIRVVIEVEQAYADEIRIEVSEEMISSLPFARRLGPLVDKAADRTIAAVKAA